MTVIGQHHVPAALPRWKAPRCPLNRTVPGLQSRPEGWPYKWLCQTKMGTLIFVNIGPKPWFWHCSLRGLGGWTTENWRNTFNWSHPDVFHLILKIKVGRKHNKLFIAWYAILATSFDLQSHHQAILIHINTFTAIVDLSRFNNSCLKSPASTLVDLTFQSRALRSFSLNQLRNLSL